MTQSRIHPVNTSIDHLPEHKQEQLRRVVEIIREETEVEMIILFGSYAAGTWVEEPGPDPRTFEYQSDFDIYVLVEDKKVARKGSLWARVENRLRRQVPTPVGLLVDAIAAFDSYIREGRYFYTDIRTLGILLYDSEKFALAEPRELSPEQRLVLATEDFEYWFDSANGFLLNTQFAIDRADYINAVFQLHQATERLYSALLLTFTNYKPKLHDIEKLGNLAAGQAPELVPVFPIGTEEERRLFSLLRRAYIEARYDKKYRIERQELEWLLERVIALKGIVEDVCRARIAKYSGVR
ncbi:MAG: polymerase beta domain protein region [Chlorobi bacterium]|nr:polymerase beta domain protein region [Chlorobiota bacterium]